MSYLLFLDESGSDHRTAPYEVRGGIALHATRCMEFHEAFRYLEEDCFGASLREIGVEIKGERLFKRRVFRFAEQMSLLENGIRQENARRFLRRSVAGENPLRIEFTAYGQACLKFVSGLLDILERCEARVFASLVPAAAFRLSEPTNALRNDQIELIGKFDTYLSAQEESGVLVLDETEQSEDRRYLARMERYFGTPSGREAAARIVPIPFFVASHLSPAVQAADVIIYAINQGFRDAQRGIVAPARLEIAALVDGPIRRLEAPGGIFLVTNPFVDEILPKPLAIPGEVS